MTATEEINSGLSMVGDDLDRASTQAGAAADHADDVRTGALAHGWEGIAAGMQEVVDHLEQVRAAIGRAEDANAEAANPVGQIDSGMSPTAVREHLAMAIARTEGTNTAIDTALGSLDEAEVAASRSLEGGDPRHLLGLISDVGQTLVSARQHLRSASSKAEAEIQEAAQAGN